MVYYLYNIMIGLLCLNPSLTPSLQTYLSEEDFEKVFGMSIHQFRGIPKWKQNDLKKKKELF